ncbi:MAG: hypothetical protein OXF63_12315 [Anaerolineaceae bacterium]|nr:hypothetical protein [Anaerolineaceae bacterium]
MIDGLNTLLDTIAELAQEPLDLIAVLVVCGLALVVFFLLLDAVVRQIRLSCRDRARDWEIAPFQCCDGAKATVRTFARNAAQGATE